MSRGGLLLGILEGVVVFFSSRRRHTRFQGDGSSDVCSSDLEQKTPRIYPQDVDWVFHARNRVLAPGEVEAAVDAFRKAGPARVDSVPPLDPPLASPCNF